MNALCSKKYLNHYSIAIKIKFNLLEHLLKLRLYIIKKKKIYLMITN